MQKLLFYVCLSCLLVSCGSTKSARNSRGPVEAKYYEVPADKRLINIVNDALTYEGTRYKWGGTTRKGMDCSGLVYVAYNSEQIILPRVSRNMAREGKRVSTREITIGDLLFFKTERSKRINHVGLVVDIRPGEVIFIHSTTSRGVIISSLGEKYWKQAYMEARKII